METDNIIQTTLRENLPAGITVIVVAHRLQTVLDADRIVSKIHPYRKMELKPGPQVVLDSGNVVSIILLSTFLRRHYLSDHAFSLKVEFDTPAALLQRPHGYFRTLAEHSRQHPYEGEETALIVDEDFEI